MIITAIMSVFNGANYLKDSIGSMLAQTSPHWRLICIDDGSSDNSLALLREYAASDERITVLHQENRGLSIARAVAFAQAETEYVSILDCDDALAPDYVERMLETARQTRADAIISDVEYGFANTPHAPNHFVQHSLSEEFRIADGVDALRLTVPWRIHGWFCIKREIVQRHYTLALAGSSTYKHYFDEYMARLMLYRCNTFALCGACYRYRVAEGSITRSLSLNKLGLLASLDHLLDLCIAERLPDELLLRVYNEYYCQIVNLWKQSRGLPPKEVAKGRAEIKAFYGMFRKKCAKDIIASAPLRTRVKLRFVLMGFSALRVIAQC